MNNKYYKSLYDILECINRIEGYIGTPQLFDNYNSNMLVQHAVERNLITIGEAMNRLLEINTDIKITNTRKIINARNKISHGYDEIENVQIWSIIINHLPKLKSEVQILLND